MGGVEDFLAWPLEKTGIFTVRSTYNLALELQNLNTSTASSVAPEGDRRLWNNVWKGGKLSRNALPTRRRKFVKNIELEDTCMLCGLSAETGHHATIVCPQAFNLRQGMRQHWSLPDEKMFEYTGPDWLLLLLDRCSPEQRDLTRLVLWRSWTVHNNITHQSEHLQVEEWMYILLNLWELMTQSRQHTSDNGVGQRPQTQQTKINVDGSFVVQSGTAGIGVVARNPMGEVLLSAWRVLFRCADAAEAEARALTEGIRLASQWIRGQVIIESDCARIVKAMKCKEDSWSVVHVKRECNVIANELALLARCDSHPAVWLGRAPACVANLVENDCTRIHT
ncbi:hypothetical protein SETIT_6G139500v2 [Setaria italica]|uniref:RNase H type-1 domain-containing protein n=1 Tax=Setaria italica TaxID=4555 RepID=K3YLQ0_SETIT|nr:hypothetical protein SETIT_6G139500v2 [Setaria italica]